MLKLSSPGATPASDQDATFHQLLLACHGRIRGLAPAFAALRGARPTDPRAIQTANGLLRYLRVGLVQHAEDEDQTLAPRLLDLHDSDDLRVAVEAMEDEHGAVEDGRRAAIHALQAWLDGDDPEGHGLAAASAWLDGVLLPHIAQEEATVFPGIARLPEAERARMLVELRQRRQG